MTNQEILNYPFEFNDCDANNIKEYFHELLHTLWFEGEGFSGKRPLGNSCWEYDIYSALVEMGAVEGSFSYYEGEREGLDRVNKEQANKLVFELIEECFK